MCRGCHRVGRETATPDKMLAPVQLSECLPLLPRLSRKDNWALLRTAGRAGGFSRPAIPILTKMLEEPWANRQDAARAWRCSAPRLRVPSRLLEMLASNWGDSRQEAIAALRQIASADSALLLAGLKHPQAEIRAGVVELLGHFPGTVAVVTERSMILPHGSGWRRCSRWPSSRTAPSPPFRRFADCCRRNPPRFGKRRPQLSTKSSSTARR